MPVFLCFCVIDIIPLDQGIFISHPVIHSILRIQFTFCFGFFAPPLLLFSNLSHHSPPPLTKSIQPSTMAYHALDQKDSQEDTVILLGCSSTSSTVFKGVDDINDSQHQERQLATPRNLVSMADALEWLQNYEEIARANNWSSRAKLNIVAIYLQYLVVQIHSSAISNLFHTCIWKMFNSSSESLKNNNKT